MWSMQAAGVAMSFKELLIVLMRWASVVLLCWFALLPCKILFHKMVDIFTDPRTLGWRWLLSVGICFGLLYFLLLLAYRALTGQGGRTDEGLLPPLALQVFAVLFAALSAALSVLGLLWNGQLEMIFCGLFGLIGAAFVFKLASLRRRARGVVRDT